MIKYQDRIFRNAGTAVLLAAYNGEKYLSEQLDSLLSQTCTDFVCFIHDDGSTDGTLKLIDEYCGRYPQRFVRVDGPKCGNSKLNFLFLLYEIRADYFMFCDQDDVWLNDKVEKTFNAMEKLEREFGSGIPLCVYTDLKVTAADLREISESYYRFTGKNPEANSLKELLTENVAAGNTMMINFKLRQQALMVRHAENIFMHDWWCALICAAKGHFCYIDEPLILYRQHAKNAVGARKRRGPAGKLRNMSNPGQWIFINKSRVKRQRKSAGELAEILPEEDPLREFLSALAGIGGKNRLKRTAFYCRNGLFTGKRNLLVQILFV